jgi:glycogen synthase
MTVRRAIRVHPERNAGSHILNILIISREYPPIIAGGVTVVHNLANGMRRRGHHVLVYTFCLPGESEGLQIFDGIEIYRSPSFAKCLYFQELDIPRIFDEVQSFVGDRKPDVIHANDLSSCFVGGIISTHFDSSFAFTYHATPDPATRIIRMELMPDAVSTAMSRQIFRHGSYDVLIAASKYYAEAAAEQGADAEKIRQVYFGVDIERFTPSGDTREIADRLSLKDGEPVILVPARITPRKRIHLIISALPRILASYPNVKVIVTGTLDSGTLSDPLYSQSIVNKVLKKQLNSSVTFTDTIPEYLMPQLYRLGTICVMPSAVEGLGMSVLEAMSSGTPVIAAQVRGINEIIEDHVNGLYFADDDADSLADTVIELLADDSLQESLGNAGRTKVIQEFALDVGMAKIEAVYKDLIATKKK